MADIILEGVTKRYADGSLAVRALDLQIADGELVVLVGPSGCGKSTTLNMIAGLEEITEGELRIGGELVTHKSPRERDIAMVFQSYALYPHLSVRENMAFPLELARLDKATIERKVREAAEILGLTAYLERKPAQLSGGQRQRVSMGRAIVRAPAAFLMDEPLSNLEAKLRVQMRAQIARLQRDLATTTVYVTHDQTEAMTLGDRVVVMCGGTIQQAATPVEIYRRPLNKFVAGFIGSPAMNFFPVTLEEDRLRSSLGDIPLMDDVRQALLGRRVARELVAGIRPEHIAEPSREAAPGRQHVLEAKVELLEFTGADVYAYFGAGERASADDAAELEPGSRAQLIARLHPDTTAQEREAVRLSFDPARLLLFDPVSGKNLLLG